MKQMKGLDELAKKVSAEYRYRKKTGNMRCLICKRKMKKINEHTYEPTCKHGKGLIVSVG